MIPYHLSGGERHVDRHRMVTHKQGRRVLMVARRPIT